MTVAVTLRTGGARLVVLCLLLAAGCDFPGKPKEEDKYVRPNDVVKFGELYKVNCAACHGADGKLGPAPPLNDPLFLAIVPDTELTRVISEGRLYREGGAKTLMPAFAVEKGGQLTDKQVKILAEGIKERWGRAEPPKGEVPPYSAPVGNKDEGARVFARACAACHGEHGQGVMRGGKRRGAINDLVFLALISDQALRRYVITGRPDLGMPNYAEKTGRADDFKPLTSQEVGDVVALLAYWRQGGSGNDK